LPLLRRTRNGVVGSVTHFEAFRTEREDEKHVKKKCTNEKTWLPVYTVLCSIVGRTWLLVR
jgi:hypothetical protein